MWGNLLAGLFIAGSIAHLVSRIATEQTPETPLTPWNEQPGSSNSLRSNGNKDMSMAIEAIRRRTIAAVHRTGYRPIKESVHTSGSTSGYIESYMLTSVCPPVAKTDIILDGEGAGDDICAVYDANIEGGTVYDAGNANTLVCGV